jgi:hypothetical protein
VVVSRYRHKTDPFSPNRVRTTEQGNAEVIPKIVHILQYPKGDIYQEANDNTNESKCIVTSDNFSPSLTLTQSLLSSKDIVLPPAMLAVTQEMQKSRKLEMVMNMWTRKNEEEPCSVERTTRDQGML